VHQESANDNQDWKYLFNLKQRKLVGATALAVLTSVEPPAKYEGLQAFLVSLNKLLLLAGLGELVCPPELADSFASE